MAGTPGRSGIPGNNGYKGMPGARGPAGLPGYPGLAFVLSRFLCVFVLRFIGVDMSLFCFVMVYFL